MIKKIILSCVATLSLLQAQTLRQSVEVVLDTNPIVLERLSNFRETSKDLSIARAEYLPTLDLVSSLGYEATDNENSNILAKDTSLTYYENSLTLMLNLFDGFSTNRKVDYQKARIVAAAYNFIEKANDTAFETTRRYIEVIKQRELLGTAKENVSINEEIFAKVKELYNAGLTTKSEMRKIESSLFLARSNLVVQENNTIDAVFNFKKNYGERIDLDTLEIPSFNVLLPKTLNEATAYAVRNNPSIMVSQYNIKSSQHLKRQKEKNYYPKIDAMVQQNLDKNTYGLEDERNRFRAGLVLTYNLYRGGADADTVSKAVSTIYRDVQTKNELQRQIIEGLELSWSAYTMIEKQLIELLRYRDFSIETLDLYKEEYDIGRRTLLDLLSAQNDLINAKSQIIRANYDSLFAKYRILDSMGLLVAGIMGNDYKYMERVGIVGVDAVENEDTLPVNYDNDKDNIPMLTDMCQASAVDSDVLSNGCVNRSSNFSKVKHFGLIQFDRDENNVSSIDALNSVISQLIENNENLSRVLVMAHASSTSDRKNDLNASKSYANMVKNSIVDAGIDDKLIKVVSDGSNAPISSDESLNDRVNIIMYLKQ
ncbi:TolC family outer membrane protein [Sulfurimonas aquatica]|uniref:TolC family outer membrane protein n=1 Tax=Sulfurimonas aquatica TaxID=2672570 RepID=A0A975AZM7_9BACT|nr:TolC family outer membrane protein [Sulfurimonas aquatica]QSZ41521.1 TolC family outer membrane protein [Sulfurimonas aquatica]